MNYFEALQAKYGENDKIQLFENLQDFAWFMDPMMGAIYDGWENMSGPFIVIETVLTEYAHPETGEKVAIIPKHPFPLCLDIYEGEKNFYYADYEVECLLEDYQEHKQVENFIDSLI